MSDPNQPSTVMSQAPPTDGEGDEAYCAACNQSFSIDAQFCPNDGAKLVKLKAPVDHLLGRVFDDRYEIRTQLGHGGMGSVYRGWQRSVDREVAIKVIRPKLAEERAIAKRFLREARLASRLSQPNIVNVYDFGQTEDGILYLVMELLRGHPLSKELETGRPLPISRIKTIAAQICDALEAAHGQGIVHRDLKPGNIVILDDPPGRDLVKILDFGLAKSLIQENTSLVTKTDAILGTPLYMPPEQILGKASDQTADLYSLGCILYQLATGRPPFVGENINVVLAAHVAEPVPPFPDHVPAALADVIHDLMDKDPATRTHSARIVHDRLDAIADDSSTVGDLRRPMMVPRPGSAGPTPPPMAPSTKAPPVTHPSLDIPPRRRWMLPLFATVLLAGVVFVVVRATTTGSEPQPEQTGGGSDEPTGSAIAPGVVPDASVATIDQQELAAPPDARVPSVPDAHVVVAVPDARIRRPARDARRPIRPRVIVDAGVSTRPRPHPPRRLDAGTPPKRDALDLPFLDPNGAPRKKR